MIAKQPDRGCAAMTAPVGLSSGRTFWREQDGGALPRQVPRVWLFCFFTKISCFLCRGHSCGAGLYGFYKMHCRRIRSLLRAKREPERTAVPAGHESPSGTFEPQTGLRSKCRVFSAARARRFRCAAAGRSLFSFGTKREPEKCQRFRRAGATKKGLLAPFNPKGVGCTGKN